eukprot:scaffold62153_cov61-Phaeocystis_antarctica.AAC.12
MKKTKALDELLLSALDSPLALEVLPVLARLFLSSVGDPLFHLFVHAPHETRPQCIRLGKPEIWARCRQLLLTEGSMSRCACP